MSFDEGNLVDGTSFIDTVTNTSGANSQRQSGQYSNQKSASSSLIYQALFSTGENSQSQGTESVSDITTQRAESVSWAKQSHAPSTEAESREWSSFSDISNAISPAASNESVESGWKETESESDLLAPAGQSEAACGSSVRQRQVDTTPYWYEPVRACVSQNVSKGERFSDYRGLHGGAAKFVNTIQEGVTRSVNPGRSANVAQIEVAVQSLTQEKQGVWQTLNNECFEAAVSEKKKSDLSRKIIARIRQNKGERRHQHTYNDGANAHESHHPNQQHEKQQPQPDLQGRLSLQHQDQPSPHNQQAQVTQNNPDVLPAKTFVYSSVECVTSGSVSIYVSPKSPSNLSASSGDNSDGSTSKCYNKKYRYNQTAAALQKSGLFKTTMKTAELLQRNQLLQQELQKLRRETMVFVNSVLSNPENAHLKKIYMNPTHEIS